MKYRNDLNEFVDLWLNNRELDLIEKEIKAAKDIRIDETIFEEHLDGNSQKLLESEGHELYRFMAIKTGAEAKELISQLVAQEPSSAFCIYHYYRFMWAEGKLKKAIKYAEKVKHLTLKRSSPNRHLLVKILVDLSYMCAQFGDLEKSRDYLKLSFEHRPHSDLVRFLRKAHKKNKLHEFKPKL